MKTKLLNEINKLNVYDVHTHLSSTHMAARGLHDVLLYHMVISELYAAGCPNGARIDEFISDEQAAARIEEALPYLPYIKNTSIYSLMRRILSELYDWHEELTLKNWREADKLIRARYNENDPKWVSEVFERAGIKRAVTELCRRNEGRYDSFLQYSLEWAFFARSQWGQFDTTLLELEHAWEQEEPGEPLPVTAGALSFKRRIETVSDVYEAIDHYCDKIPVSDIVSTAQHISTDIRFFAVSEEQMEGALKNRAHAGERERDIYASFVFLAFLKAFEKKCKGLMFQFSFGAEPLPFETGSKLRTESVFELADILSRYPNMRFQAMLSSAHHNQAICTLVRELPNLSVTGYWWHNFYPSFIRRIIDERLDMLPVNKQIGFFSDAYCVDWMYIKCHFIKELIAERLEQRVLDGQYSFEQAVDVAKDILVHSPETLLGMK